jgi:hypothetical protein
MDRAHQAQVRVGEKEVRAAPALGLLYRKATLGPWPTT